jgi:2,5-diketo-D-gluconate reductase A
VDRAAGRLQSGLVAIPKSSNPRRIAENIALLDFALDADDMSAIDALDIQRGRIGPNPAALG